MSDTDDSKAGNKVLPRFRIGGVTKMTGIPVDTLRAWERRYQVVSPVRAESSARLYSLEDIERLKLLKTLVSEGHGIGSVAHLDRSTLENLLDKHTNEADVSHDDGQKTLGVLTFFDNHAPVTADTLKKAGLELLGEHQSWPAFQADALGGNANALILELSVLSPQIVSDICVLAVKKGHRRIIVIYGFSSASLTERLRREGISVLRAPVDQEEIIDNVRRSRDVEPINGNKRADSVVARSIDEQVLDYLSLIETSVECECPKHLVDIIRTLNRFEDYCVSCENRNDADAALHVALRATTATARASFEQSLVEVIENEEIELPQERG